MISAGRTAALSVDGENLIVAGSEWLKNRQARLFFRGILGAEETPHGWRCPRRRTAMPVLILRVNKWLDQQGYRISRNEIVAAAVERELERQRSYLRTREAALSFKQGAEEIDLARIEQTLVDFGWSNERQLHPHQWSSVAHGLTAVNAANFSVPGAGKTAATLAIATTHLHAGTIDIVVVVGPLACFDPWEQETLAALGGRIHARRVRGSTRQRNRAYDQASKTDLLLLSYATATADQQRLIELFDQWRTMLIVDESHRVKRFRGGAWAPALLEIAKRARVRMILSGTPMPQSGKDLYTQMNILWPDGHLTGTRDAFAVRVDNSFGKVLSDVYPFVSRTPKSALSLPPYQIQRHEVELVGTQAEVYELIEGRFRRQLSDATTWHEKLEVLKRGRPIRLLQAASNPALFNEVDAYYQVPRLENRDPTLMDRLESYTSHEIPAKSTAALEIIREIQASGGKVVCWSNFVPNLDHFRNLVRDQLGIACFQIDGRVPAGDDALHEDPAAEQDVPGETDTREAIIRRFLDLEEPAVLVTNPASCSESISLHRSCRNAIYLDRTYDCALYLQSIDRIHRLGLPADAHVTIHLLQATVYGRSTIDQLVDASLLAKEGRMKQLLEGAELAPLQLSDEPAKDAEGTDEDLATLLRYLLGEAE